jgi:aromatic ring-opening dioxygenase LigB subunit
VIDFAAIAPHGDVDLDPELRAAMDELGRRFDASGCESAIVVTPHNVHVEGHFAVVTAARVGPHDTDRELAASLVEGARRAALPVTGVSYGGNDPAEAELPLDWGTEIPLRYIPAERIILVAPARDRALEEHVRLGELLRDRALIASADHAHAHDPEGPYGFDPAAAAYDERFQACCATGDFRPLGELVEAARADSLWQLLVLQGATGGRPLELLASGVPSYYGMAVAIGT